MISIPAPPRGASDHPECRRFPLISIPAPPRGASCVLLGLWAALLFQYQPLHEGLPTRWSMGWHRRNFNTSPSTRGFPLSIRSWQFRQFQYQPLHEGLPADSCGIFWRQDFNTSPSTRGFRVVCPGKRRRLISIPAPPRGASSASTDMKPTQIFQYQPLHEGLRATPGSCATSV